ncbi:methyltransferase [Streptomyces shenzhenensis]|uniref:methyltransferase n=1 Tax=Streptomyces shenzhenensis TaxID=943815 RepID=UPI0015F09140|nr:methyltransferase [Streptomyces shenzhenensis]
MDTTDVDTPLNGAGYPSPRDVIKSLRAPVKDVVDSDDPRAVIWDVIRGQWKFSALYAFVELDLARWMDGGSVGVRELAERCGLDAVSLARLLRTNATLGVVTTAGADGGPGDERYALTAAGRTLRAGDERSMRSVVIPQGAPDFLDAMSCLADAVRTGHAPFATRFGSFYSYLDSHPEAREHFDAHMATRSRTMGESLAAQYDFTGVTSIGDIGGGLGTILSAILKANPGMRGVLHELEPVVARARPFLASEGVLDRCELVAGDFFEAVPAADAYLLSNIVHNWADEAAVTILGNVRSAMPAHGRVLLLDMLLPDDDRPHLGKELDMRLLALHEGGRERSEGEYLAVVRRAGLAPRRIIELPYALSLIEAFAA